jgi:pyruvate ferredoxin oxidoreductase beta subunit/2-oxoisovalerate ferredoxin oxidoreductase beta subunit
MSQIVIKDRIPREELLASGHLACPGCGGSLAMRLVLKALGPRTMITLPAFCWTLLSGPAPRSALGVRHLHMAPGTTAATASGIRAALDALGDTETTVLAWSDIGGTSDAGLQALSGAAERNEDILYVCHEDEAGMNTGIQCSPATPWDAGTTTAPTGAPRFHPRKDLIGILAAHRIPYAASSTVAHPVDLIEKVQKARAIRGTRFLLILAPCPPGWGVSSEETIDLARQAVRTRVFPLFEVENGQRWRFTTDHPGDPVEPYLRRQGRFRHLTPEQVRRIQSEVDARWETLKRSVESGS